MVGGEQSVLLMLWGKYMNIYFHFSNIVHTLSDTFIVNETLGSVQLF
jgi:hypothetical protein